MAEAEASVKVFIRFRPLNKREKGEKDAADCRLEIEENGITLSLRGKTNNFAFDRVFENESQETVYDCVAKESVSDVLNGFNSTVFAYGQTGAGKSHTMFGNPEHQGIIPRAAEEIFSHIERSTQAREWSIKASFLEIYREQLKDLLSPSTKKLQIRERKGKIWIENLSEEYVTCAGDVLELIQQGEKLRSTSSTKMNETSSRSHSVFMLRIQSKPENAEGEAARSAVLNLIDLAGSERVGKTGATGQTLKEAQKINQSLSALGNVINALSSGNADHIPYRDSQLTRLLQESLGGNCKTRLVVACSPHAAFNGEETLSSLRFGQRAKSVKNKIHKNVSMSVEELKKVIKDLKAELKAWKAYAENLKQGKGGDPPSAESVAAIPEEQSAVSNAEQEKKIDELNAEIEKLQEKCDVDGAANDELTAALAELQKKYELKQDEYENNEEVFQERIRDLESQIAKFELQKKVEESEESPEQVFMQQIEALQSKINNLQDASQNQMKEKDELLLQLKAKDEEYKKLEEEVAELRLYKETQSQRKARLFKPLKSGGGGKVHKAFAEKIDHTEVRKGLKKTGANLWK